MIIIDILLVKNFRLLISFFNGLQHVAGLMLYALATPIANFGELSKGALVILIVMFRADLTFPSKTDGRHVRSLSMKEVCPSKSSIRRRYTSVLLKSCRLAAFSRSAFVSTGEFPALTHSSLKIRCSACDGSAQKLTLPL